MGCKKKKERNERRKKKQFFFSFIFLLSLLLFVTLVPCPSLSPLSPSRLFEMEEESDGPDVVAIGRRREIAGAAAAAGATDASRGGAASAPSSALAGINPSSSTFLSLGGEQQREPQEPLVPVLTKNQKHKLRQKRCRLAKRLTMQVREERRLPGKKASPSPPNECPPSFVFLLFDSTISPVSPAAAPSRLQRLSNSI